MLAGTEDCWMSDHGVVPEAAAAADAGEFSKQRTLEAMRVVLARRFGINDPDLSLDRELDSLGLDSLAFIEYAFELETELHVNLPDLPRDMVTVGDLFRFVHGEVERKSAEPVAK